MKTVLSIAGSDPCGGAGIQADLKTIHTCGGYALTAITAVTAQNTQGVQAVYPLPAEQLQAQLNSLIADIPPDAIKLGMLGNLELVEVFIAFISTLKRKVPIVCDTVLLSSSGKSLLADDALATYQQHLLPLCDWLTPNLPESQFLLSLPNTDSTILTQAWQQQCQQYGYGVILKGGHSDDAHCRDTLITATETQTLSAPKICTPNLHGTGCTFASAFATFLAQGLSPQDAFAQTKTYLTQAIEQGRTRTIGQGNGPLCHFPTVTTQHTSEPPT